jgi:hypothetical protein
MLILGAGMLTACRDSSAPEPAVFDLSVVTDKPSYVTAVDRLVHITITNRSNRTVYMPGDFYVFSERMIRGTWGDPFAWFFAGGTPAEWIPLAPNATKTDALPLYYYAGLTTSLRMRYLVYEDPELRRSLPIHTRVSSTIGVVP